MTTKLILHIGTEKTGTSSIQRFCWVNYATLLKAGVLYPRSLGKPGHKLFASAFVTERRNDDHFPPSTPTQTLALLQREIAASKPAVVVLSSEQLSSRLRAPQISALREWCDHLHVPMQVLVYLRRQDEFLLSSYSTAIKGRYQRPFSATIALRNKQRYDYAGLLARWRTYFDDSVVRVYEPERLVHGNLIADFCAAIGFEMSPGTVRLPPRTNSSLAPDLLEYKRISNCRIWSGDANPAAAWRASARLLQILESLSSPYAHYTLLEPDARAQILAAYADTNDAVAQQVHGKGRRLFEAPVDMASPVYRPTEAARVSDLERIEREVARGSTPLARARRAIARFTSY